MRRSRVLLFVVLAAVLVTAACSSSSAPDAGDDASAGTDPTTSTTTFTSTFDPDSAGATTVDGPITGGNGRAVVNPPSVDLDALGYTEEEFFVSGTASSYTSPDRLTADGEWAVEPAGTADYTTRLLVRRPADAADFNGTVFVEWLNVSGGLDASPEWSLGGVGIARAGAAWVGVSAQQQGIEGEGGLAAGLRLKNADPERYGPLSHPGDSFSYDLYAQVGAAVRTHADPVLGGLEPERVIAMGESQSAFRLTTFVNALAPVVRAYDGFLLHSRSDAGAPLSQAPQADLPVPAPTRTRTDLDVPVLVFSTETDVAGTGLGYAAARQDDTDRLRGWEVAGTAHYDAYGLETSTRDDGTGPGDVAAFELMLDPPNEVAAGLFTCDSPVNAGPQQYVFRAALAALDRWVATGEAPPEQPRLDTTADDAAFEVDDTGNATGGIRTPHVDVPVAVLSGLGQGGTSFCSLFGTTRPLTGAELTDRYPDHDAFVEAWDAAVDEAVAAGALLEADGENLKAAAAQSTVPDGSAPTSD